MSILSPLAEAVTGTNRILHVDDDPDFADLTATFLEREHDRFAVETVTSASEGLERLADTEFDCVVSDYEMPGRNGIEFLEAVRERHPDLPFILFTGRGSEAVASDAISAGVTDYLQKERGTDQYTVLANRIRNAIEHYRSQRTVERSEARLRKIIDALPHLLYVVDDDGTYLLANEALAEFHDASVEEIEGSTVDDVLGDAVADRFRRNVAEVLASGTPTRFSEVEVADPRGETHVFEPRVLPYDLDDSTKTAVLGIAADVTERKERERELERYEAYLEESNDIITVLDESGTVDYESPSVTRILGYDPGELVGQDGFEFVHPDDRERVAAAFEDLVSDPGGTVTVECRFRTAEDEWKWLEVRGTNQLDNDAIRGVVTNNRDITERREEERKRQQTIDRVTDAIVEVDADWRFTVVNDQAEELYDMDEASLLGRDFWEVFAEARDTRFETEYRRVMETREPTSFVERYAGLDGWFEIQVYPNDDGGIAFYFREVSDRLQRERRYDAVFNHTYQFTGLLTPDGTLVEANDTVLEFGGVDREDVVGTKLWETDWFRHSEEAREGVRTAVIRAADGEFVRRELPVQGADREAVIDFSVRPVTDERGTVTLLVPEGRDITERTEYERELKRIRDFFAEAERLGDLGAWEFDATGEVVWTAGTRRIHDVDDDYTPTVEEGLDFFHPEDRAMVREAVETALATGEPYDVQARLITAAGAERWVRTRGEPVDGTDTVRGYIQDITDRKEREGRLEALNETTRALVSATSREEVAAIGVEAGCDILDLEANAIHLADEAQSGLVPVAQTEANRELVGEAPTLTEGDSIAWRVYESGEALALDDVHDDPDIHNPDSPVRSELYLPIGEYGIMIDASATPEAFDREDVALGKLLASHVATALDQVDRTEELRARERSLERQNDRLERFASVVSHDLRTPLSLIEGRLELATETCDCEHLDAMGTAVDRMDRIIEDVLCLAREGRDIDSLDAVAVRTAVGDAWDLVADDVDRGVLRYADDERALPTIEADDNRLRQLLENLLRNAVDHAGEDVTVTVGALDDGFYVADDGPGIPVAKRDEVFDAGYSTAENGIGFGLSIVKHVADAHGWGVDVTESSGGGARFEITGVETVST